ncbi:MAG TPA: glycosyltransferase family 2 protein [Candidatus Saccharimonadales bacterium]
MTQKQLISIIVPVRNESLNIPILQKAIQKRFTSLPYKYELIFVDDGSRDNSVEVIQTLMAADQGVRLLEFARNFGKEAAVSAGLHAARGEAAIIMDGDMQHPPHLIKDFLMRWQRGAEVVVGLREYSQKESWFKRWSSKQFYKIMGKVSDTKITPNATDYRLLDRSAIEAFKQMTERNRITRGLIDWLGFSRDYVRFEASPRLHGKAAYSYKLLFRLALHSFTAHSFLPLKLAGYLGILILLISGPLGVYIFLDKYMLHNVSGFNFSGTALLAVILLFLVGIILSCLGLVSMYIARIHDEVMNRPLYVVKPEESAEQIAEKLNEEEAGAA